MQTKRAEVYLTLEQHKETGARTSLSEYHGLGWKMFDLASSNNRFTV